MLKLVLLLVSLTLLACSSDPPQPPTPAPTPIAVSAQEFYGAYKANEVRADATYTDELVAVSGTVGQIDGYEVKLIGGAMGASGMAIGMLTEAIVCKLDKEKDEAVVMSLNLGDTVTVVGTSKGMGFTDIELGNCAVIKNGEK